MQTQRNQESGGLHLSACEGEIWGESTGFPDPTRCPEFNYLEDRLESTAPAEILIASLPR